MKQAGAFRGRKLEHEFPEDFFEQIAHLGRRAIRLARTEILQALRRLLAESNAVKDAVV